MVDHRQAGRDRRRAQCGGLTARTRASALADVRALRCPLRAADIDRLAPSSPQSQRSASPSADVAAIVGQRPASASTAASSRGAARRPLGAARLSRRRVRRRPHRRAAPGGQPRGRAGRGPAHRDRRLARSRRRRARRARGAPQRPHLRAQRGVRQRLPVLHDHAGADARALGRRPPVGHAGAAGRPADVDAVAAHLAIAGRRPRRAALRVDRLVVQRLRRARRQADHDSGVRRRRQERPHLRRRGCATPSAWRGIPRPAQLWTTDIGQDQLSDDSAARRDRHRRGRAGTTAIPFFYGRGVPNPVPEVQGAARDRSPPNRRCRRWSELPAHTTPLGLTFYTGTQFPAAYRHALFVSMKGIHGAEREGRLQAGAGADEGRAAGRRRGLRHRLAQGRRGVGAAGRAGHRRRRRALRRRRQQGLHLPHQLRS